VSRPGLTICPLDLGTLTGMDKSIFTIRQNQGVKVDVPCLAYVILGGSKRILVDTGPCNPEFAARYHRPIRKEPRQEIQNALGSVGVDPAGVDLVVLTHLHWDHCFNLEHFPRATFLVQKKELHYAAAPLPADRPPYEAGVAGIQPPWTKVFDRIVPLDGDTDLIPGVRAIFLPGHTPGFQGVAVETENGPWAIVGDTVPLYENWRTGTGSPKVPGGIYQNLYDYYATLERLTAFGDNVLPGHEEQVLASR
jgi:N-acyl homoserine lactone hydrolase